MRSSLLALVVLAFGNQLPGQSIAVGPSPDPNVHVIPPSDPTFLTQVSAVVGEARSSTENDWLPYSVVLSNATAHVLIGATFTWTLYDASGRVLSTVDLIADWLSTDSPSGQVQPSQSVLVLAPKWIFRKPLPAGGADATDQPNHAAAIARFRSAAAISLGVDGIVYDSGCSLLDPTI